MTPSPTAREELLPCPFCGEQPAVISHTFHECWCKTQGCAMAFKAVGWMRWNARAQRSPAEQHIDDYSVDQFAAAMKAKLAKKRAEGRHGWHDDTQCEVSYLADLLIEHCGKVNSAVDIGNFAMMIHQRTKSRDGSFIPEANLAARLKWRKMRVDLSPAVLQPGAVPLDPMSLRITAQHPDKDKL